MIWRGVGKVGHAGPAIVLFADVFVMQGISYQHVMSFFRGFSLCRLCIFMQAMHVATRKLGLANIWRFLCAGCEG